jgi:hypothetical protein
MQVIAWACNEMDTSRAITYYFVLLTCMLKAKLDILGISCAIGFVTILLILSTATNGYVNSAYGQEE